MKKIFSLIVSLIMILLLTTFSYADSNEEYHFELNYEGDVIENEAKSAEVLLVGIDGQLYTNVRIKIEGTGPATPEVVAYDSEGTKYDVADIGYWGPASGFSIQGTFTNTTPVTITYPEAGTYTTTLQLLDVANDNAVITSNVFTITVLSADSGDDDTYEDEVDENVIDEIPQAGINLLQCCIYLFIVAAIFFVILKKRKN